MINRERRVKLNSFLAAAVLAETNICAIASAFITIPMISVLLMALILIACIFLNGHSLNINSNSVVAYVLFTFLLVISMLFNGINVPGLRFLYFITFGTASMFVVSVRQDSRLILKYLLYIYTVHLIVYFFLQRDVFLNTDDFWDAQMGVAYGFVPPVIICVILLLYRKKIETEGIITNKPFLQVIFYVTVFLLSAYVFLIDCGTRGVIIVAIVGIMFICGRKLTRKMKIIFGLISVAFLIFVYMNWNTIMVSSLDHFAEGNIKSLAKLSQMTEYGDASNGREDHYKIAIQMIKDNPIIGYGVGYFENIVKASYVHQLFLELLLECGIIGLILFMVPILRLIKATRKTSDDFEFSFKIYLLSCCFLPLMFSASFWMFPPFWYGFFYATNIVKSKSSYINT